MATKKCYYKGCGAFTSPAYPNPDTFYAFPKDPERCKRWMKLGACPDTVPPNRRFYCAKHFDETKYVASNPRRKQLLSTAIPWACPDSLQTDHKSNDTDYQCVESTIEDTEYDDDDTAMANFREETVAVEISNDLSTIPDDIEDALQNYDYQEVNASSEFTIFAEKLTRKRKLDTPSKQLVSASVDIASVPAERNVVSNRATSSTLTATRDDPKHGTGTKPIEVFDESKLLEESRNLTTFIFKGQEYIQMPKDEYVADKMALMDKIKSLEEVLKNVKQLVEGVKI